MKTSTALAELSGTSQASQSALPRKRDVSRGNKAWFKRGVAQREKHGLSKTKTYKIWSGMLSRCYTPSATGFANYGGRGISVCDRWRIFDNFIADMGECPEGSSIDRIDANGNYEPSNCRWSSRKEQNRNQRDLVMLTLHGRTQCVAAWGEELGITAGTIHSRIRYGWDVERILTTQPRRHKEYVNAKR